MRNTVAYIEAMRNTHSMRVSHTVTISLNTASVLHTLNARSTCNTRIITDILIDAAQGVGLEINKDKKSTCNFNDCAECTRNREIEVVKNGVFNSRIWEWDRCLQRKQSKLLQSI